MAVGKCTPKVIWRTSTPFPLLTMSDEIEWYFQYSEHRVQGSYLPDMFCSSILTADENLVQDIFLIFIDL